ncbi:hypothetical protein [Streptomyces sp. SGAir0957]
MSRLPVPLSALRLGRLATTTVAVAAAAGCMSVADDADGRPPAPSHSATHREQGAAPDGGTMVTDGVGPAGARSGQRPARPEGSASASESPGAASPTASAPQGGGQTPAQQQPRPGRSTPSARPSTPRATPTTPTPTPTKETPTPTPTPSPTTAEPSSSAHEQRAAPQLMGEPEPRAGSPA